MMNRRLGSLVLGHCVVAALAASCGGTTSKVIPQGEAGSDAESHSGSGGRGGATTSGNGGKGGKGGSSGTSTSGGASNESGAAGESAGESGAAGASGSGATSGSGDAGSGDAGSSDAGDGGASGATNQEPPIDVGPGCLQPPSAPALSPSAAGFPANGLTVWLRGDRGVYATDQHRVCAWADQSGNQFLFQATSGARPLWDGSGLGAQAAIDFDSTNSPLSIAGVLGIPATSGRTFIAVTRSVDLTGRFAAVQQGTSSWGTYIMIDANTYNTQGGREGVYICNNSYDTTLPTSTSPRVHVYTIKTMVKDLPVLSNIDYRVNGVAQTLTRNDGGFGNGNIEDFSSASYSLVGAGAHAVIAEALIYNRPLELEERVAVETALKARYGIQ